MLLHNLSMIDGCLKCLEPEDSTADLGGQLLSFPLIGIIYFLHGNVRLNSLYQPIYITYIMLKNLFPRCHC